jgi:hypothetical protein
VLRDLDRPGIFVTADTYPGTRAEVLGAAAGERTWRAPLSYRAALVLVHTALVAAAASFGWVTLSSNQLPGQVVLAVWVPLWTLLAFRSCTVSATLTEDTLVIRNVLSTERLLTADITKVALSARSRALKVTEWRPPSPAVPEAASARHRDPGERYTVTAVQVGLLAGLTGARCEGDEAADRIAAAAGLPPLPARPPLVSREKAMIMIPAGIILFASGVALSALGHLGGSLVPGALRAPGALLFILGATAELARFIQRRRST